MPPCCSLFCHASSGRFRASHLDNLAGASFCSGSLPRGHGPGSSPLRPRPRQRRLPGKASRPGKPRPRALAFEVGVPVDSGRPHRSRPGFTCCSAGQLAARAAVRARLVPSPAVLCPGRQGLEAGADRADRLHGDRLPWPARLARARRLHDPGGRPAQPRHPQHRHRRGERVRPGRSRQARPEGNETIRLEVDKLVPPRKFQETDRIKLVELESPLLSAFHHRPIKHRAAVILPAGEGRRQAARRSTSSPGSAATITWRGCSRRTRGWTSPRTWSA